MARRARTEKREIIPDAKYRSITVSRLIVKVMERGKKRTAENVVYNALEKLGQQVSKDPVTALEQAVKNATPLLQVKPRRVGGATYQVPIEVQPDRGLFLALSWLIQSARARKGKAMHEKLADELAEAFQGQGNTIKKREDTHKMAEANRAFAHYRW
ncbi:MAG: 30S ribosomal protein S7 [Chloroflexi bacterium RBG_13_51_52]|nr:MAG: 30S ribosomal protein S7 [Chloroflexi bacterium RBG_13_51_52]